jgi:hypothetical protein
MTMTRSTPLKLGAVAFAVLWTLWMMWRSGPLDRVSVAMLTISGAVAGYLWYLAMRFVFGRLRFGVPDQSPDAIQVTRGKIYPWIVWGALVLATGAATATLLDLVDPLIPSGEQHRLISALFIIVVWPSLMWCLPLSAKRRPRP